MSLQNFSINHIQHKQQIPSNPQASSILPADFIQRVLTVKDPIYNLKALDNNTQNISTVAPSPFFNDNAPQPRQPAKREDPQDKQRDQLKNLDLQRIQNGRRRQKKSTDERKILEAEYLKDPKWPYQKKVDLALLLNFTFGQVSKWNWDRRKKEEAELGIQQKKKK